MNVLRSLQALRQFDQLHELAAQAEQHLADEANRPLGTVLCISPWNFPLAIFTGQVAAALAAGNTVIAKPAEPTPLIAAQAVRILREAGVPAGAVQLVPGSGRTIGNALEFYDFVVFSFFYFLSRN